MSNADTQYNRCNADPLHSEAVQQPQCRKPYTFLRDIFTLATSSALAQGLSFAVSPFLSRLYTPDDFGAFSIYAFIIAIPSVLVCWCYEAAVVLPKEDEEGRNIVVLSIVIASAMAAFAVIPAFTGGTIVQMLNAPALAPWLGFMPINLFALGIYQALSYWYNRTGNFGRLAVSRIIQSGLTAGSQAAGAIVIMGTGGLITGQVLGQLVASAFLWRCAARHGDLDVQKVLRPSMLVQTLYRYRRFPLFSSWGTLMSSAAFQVVPVLLSRQFGPAEAGFYYFGYRLMSSSVLLGASSIGQVFYHRAAATLNAGKSVAPLVEMVISRLTVLCALLFGVFAVFAPELFAFFFGQHWRTAGEYMRIVAALFLLQVITSPVSTVLFLLEKQHVAAFMQLLLLLGALGSFTLGALLGTTAAGTLALYASVQCVVYLMYLTIILRLTSVSPVGLLKAMVMGQWWSTQA